MGKSATEFKELMHGHEDPPSLKKVFINPDLGKLTLICC